MELCYAAITRAGPKVHLTFPNAPLAVHGHPASCLVMGVLLALPLDVGSVLSCVMGYPWISDILYKQQSISMQNFWQAWCSCILPVSSLEWVAWIKRGVELQIAGP